MIETELLLRSAFAALDDGKAGWARRCFERAAELGDPQALTALGLIYHAGNGVEIDADKAMALYRRAWRKGSLIAGLNIAALYREKRDHRAMFRWLLKVAETGDGDAQLDVAKCYIDGTGVRRSSQDAWRFLALASKSDHITEEALFETRELQKIVGPRLV